MKETKFRAWDKENKRISQSFTMDEIDRDDDSEATKSGVFFMDWSEDVSKRYTYWFSDCEIMQFTGLKDKNGKEIFEGDIVTKSLKDCGRIIGNFLVKWNLPNVGFDITGTGGHQYEVIGNIYENPELLEIQK